ncbi:MAG: hypothetical protein HN580_27485 [Deltaproteobacteria bacterium]|jgi:hypothetical protein|nr:hypothetical protein [Deltaproteobacteria bacterium]MBT4089083.1 hypothetical protein [Deltaproteobacteria bacterium]MBT4266937.1 hypothetical protein [Deltaproteobacteria bacterium]MBT4637455.1 hypothetical protein [Deltaproteobacteria bacterium]MBT6502804.1 hypothetical protein [Deltaproteobacteria bacterium]
MNIDNFLDEDISFIEKRDSSNFDDYEFSMADCIIAGRVYDQVVDLIYQEVEAGTSSLVVPISDILEGINSEPEHFELQGYNSIDETAVEGFRLIKKLKLQIFTDRELSVFKVVSIPTEFVFPYTKKYEDLYPDLFDELGSLCRMIMLEEDENLTVDAILLKRSLQNYFEQAA